MRDVFNAIADPTRRQLLDVLAQVDELPPYEMTTEFPMGRTGVSKHLAILKEAGLVEDRKVGRETPYHLNATRLRDVQNIDRQFLGECQPLGPRILASGPRG